MCGIVGYTGDRGAAGVLLSGLKRLEYRGYDSAGLAVLDENGLTVLRNKGRVQALADRVYAEWPEHLVEEAVCGIAHTRWATHGPPDEKNAHPHCDADGDLALVHNGIIENYSVLRQVLAERGHSFQSDTDTEVLAHLVADCYEWDTFQALCTALQQVKGTFGLALIDRRCPGSLFVARRGSPMVVGMGEGETIAASDAAAVVSYTRQVVYLDDDDVAVITADAVDVRNIHNIPVTRETAHLDWGAADAQKGGYDHFMLKEIMEQPDAVCNTIRGRLDLDRGTAVLSGLELEPRDIVNLNRAVLVACGTSYHAGLIGASYLEDFCDLHADVEHSAEFRYRNPILRGNDLVVAISQSGETADTLAALREAGEKGPLVTAVCNVVASTIAREAGSGVYLHAGPEIGVASTKAFTCQLTALLMMALKFGRCRRLSRQDGMEIAAEISRIPDFVRNVLEQSDHIAEIAKEIHSVPSCFFIGRGYLFPVALEGALKLKEISYIHAEGYHAAELKHGPIALLEDGLPVIALMPDVPGKDKLISNVEQCRARGAEIVGVVTEGDTEAAVHADYAIPLPRSSYAVTPVTAAVALQLLAYHAARERGCAIDQPRNLAKSVTVE